MTATAPEPLDPWLDEFDEHTAQALAHSTPYQRTTPAPLAAPYRPTWLTEPEPTAPADLDVTDRGNTTALGFLFDVVLVGIGVGFCWLVAAVVNGWWFA